MIHCKAFAWGEFGFSKSSAFETTRNKILINADRPSGVKLQLLSFVASTGASVGGVTIIGAGVGITGCRVGGRTGARVLGATVGGTTGGAVEGTGVGGRVVGARVGGTTGIGVGGRVGGSVVGDGEGGSSEGVLVGLAVGRAVVGDNVVLVTVGATVVAVTVGATVVLAPVGDSVGGIGTMACFVGAVVDGVTGFCVDGSTKLFKSSLIKLL